MYNIYIYIYKTSYSKYKFHPSILLITDKLVN